MVPQVGRILTLDVVASASLPVWILVLELFHSASELALQEVAAAKGIGTACCHPQVTL